MTAETNTTATPLLAELGSEVEQRSAVFKKELGLFDLVLTQVVFVVGTIWVGWAAKLGSQQNFFWLLAILTFYLPLAAAVIFLSRLLPLEGGLYQWTKLAFNDFVAPRWFTRLHAKYKTPVNSILFVGAITLAFGLASLIGVRTQEAFQLLDNAGGVFYAITYLALFAIPLIGLKRFGARAPFWLRLACASGFIVTVIYIGFAIVPIIAVESRITFAAKIIGAVVIANGIGLAIFLLAAKRSRNRAITDSAR
jgi:amino acid transporter